MAKTHDQFVLEMELISPTIEIVGLYKKAVDRIDVRCKICNHEWSPLAYSLREGKGCPHCGAIRGSKNNQGKTALKTQEKFIADLKRVDSTIKVIGQYVNGHSYIECECLVCSNRWSAKPYSLLQNHGCPRCAKSGTSFMEQFIRLCFEKALGTDSVHSRDKSAIGMELDIYVPELKIAIEPGNWELHKKSLKRDLLKREKCAEKDIKLITIYDKFPDEIEKPFDNDCYVYSEDLNRTDHSIIKGLITNLFADLDLNYEFSEVEWSEIEELAYANAKAKTHEDFVNEMKDIHPDIMIVGRYQNANKRIPVKCNICGFEWNGVPASILAGDGCRKCGTKQAHRRFIKNQAEFEDQVYIANPDIEVIGSYTGRHNSVKARCRICGCEWEPRASSLLRGSNHKGWRTVHKNMK